MKHMRMLDMLFAGEHPIEFNRKQNRLYINGFEWGTNLSMFDGIQLPGVATLNGRQIVDDAKEEIQRIKEQMSLNHELPVDFMVG